MRDEFERSLLDLYVATRPRPQIGPCEGRGCSREDTPQAGTWCEEARAYLCASCRPDFDFAPTEGL